MIDTWLHTAGPIDAPHFLITVSNRHAIIIAVGYNVVQYISAHSIHVHFNLRIIRCIDILYPRERRHVD